MPAAAGDGIAGMPAWPAEGVPPCGCAAGRPGAGALRWGTGGANACRCCPEASGALQRFKLRHDFLKWQGPLQLHHFQQAHLQGDPRKGMT